MGKYIFFLLLVIIQSIYSNDSDWVNVSSPIGKITSVISTDDSTILLGTSRGIRKLKSPEFAWQASEKMLEDESINSLLAANNILLAGTEKGVYSSSNNGKDWRKTSLPDSNFYCIIYTKNGMLFSKAFPGNIYSSSDMGETWNEVVFNKNEILQENLHWFGTIRYNFNGDLFIPCDSVSYLESKDNGNSWNRVVVPVKGGPGTGRLIIKDDQIIFNSGKEFFSSFDHGNTWQKILTPQARYSYMAVSLKGLLLNNSDPDGRFESTDNGLSWKEIPGIVQVSSINHQNNFLTAIGDIDYNASALVFSSDNGETWNYHINYFEDTKILSTGPDGFLYACTDWSGSFRSGDFGLTWQPIINSPTVRSISFLGEDIVVLCSGLDGLFILRDKCKKIMKARDHGLTDEGIISVLATPGGLLFAGAYSKFEDIPLPDGSKTMGHKGGGLWCSADSGYSWKMVLLDSSFKTTDNGLTWLEYSDYSEKYEPTRQPDLTVNSLSFDPEGNILVLADVSYKRGLYLSKDGKSWKKIREIDRYENANIDFVKSTNGELFSGISRSTDGGKTFNDVINGLTGDVNRIIALPGGNMLAATISGIYFLPYKGNTWFPAAFKGFAVKEITLHGSYLFASVDLNFEDEKPYLYRIPSQKILDKFSVRNPEEELWTELNKPFNSKLEFFHVDDSGNIWIADDSSHLAFSGDEGRTWKISSLPDEYINDFKISAGNKFIFLATYSGLFCSEYDKIEWKEIDLPVPAGPYGFKNAHVTSIYIEKDGNIIASTSEDGPFKNPCADTSKKVISYFQPFGNDEYGRLYSTKDTTKGWQTIETVLPSYPTSVFKGKSGNVFAALHGNGIYTSTDNGIEWNNLNKGLFQENIIYTCNLAADADCTINQVRINSEGTFYVIRGRREILHTIDEGKHWEKINPLSDSIFDIYLNKNNQLFAATGTGIFKLSDDLNTWISYSAGLSSASIFSLGTDEDGYLIAASNDGRIYKTKNKIE